ncbi:MAG: phage terminase large subunit [Candidatus Heimdallarchaeota archaeon]
MNLSNETLEEIRQQGKNSLFFLARAILGFSDFVPHIHKPICDTLQKEENTRVLIILPRDWFKSSLGSVAYSIWLAINNPNIRILIVQNSMNNARKKLASIKQMIEGNKLLHTLYPHLLPSKKGTWTGECLTCTRSGHFPEGTFEAAGTGTAVISRHYDVIIEDDTVSPEIDDMSGLVQQPTQLEIEKAIGFHRLAHPLLLHPLKSKIIVIGTRWCENDLLGWVMKNSTNFIVMSRSCRENGQIIWDRYNEEVLKELETNLGPYMFSTLFMNQPLVDINSVFKREWIRYYQDVPAVRSNLLYFTSVDPACVSNEMSSDPDYTVILTSAYDVYTGNIFVIYYDRGRFDPGETIEKILSHYRAYKPMVVTIEGIAYQRTLGYWLAKRQEKLNMPFFVDVVKGARASKEDRIRGLQPYFAAGKVFIKTEHQDLERELMSFPNAAHDDVADALSMHLESWHKASLDQKVVNETKLVENPLNADYILSSMMGRQTKRNRYPFDMGLMRDSERAQRETRYFL